MSDISIPGINSKYKTDELIKNLVEVEKIPLKRMEESVKVQKIHQETWRELNGALARLRDSARSLFGFQNPFNDRTAISSDDKVLTAVATREAVEGDYALEVNRIAEADKFLSKPQSLDFEVPEGRYGFKVGEKDVYFQFRGGKLSSFVETLNTRADGMVSARLVKNTTTTQVLLVEAGKTGTENPLTFLDSSVGLAEKLGIIEKDIASSRTFDLVQESLRPWKKPLSPAAVSVNSGTLKLTSGGEAALPVSPPLPVTDPMVLEMEVKVTYLKALVSPEPTPPPGPSIPDLGEVGLGDVTVRNNPSKVVIPEWKMPEPPKVVDDMNMVFVGTGGEPLSLKDLRDTDEFITLKVPLKTFGNVVHSLYFRNSNTYRELEVRGLRIYDPTSRGDYRPVNPVSTASNAEIRMNGITIERKNNTVDDLLPGISLNLAKKSDGIIDLKVEPDRKKIKDGIIQFVGNYNRHIADLNILTRNDENLINEIGYLSPEEKDKAKEKLGLFQGDVTLNQMRTGFQGIMMNAYPTRADRELSLLAQMGVSTNSRQGGGGYDRTKLRGYLEINESVLDETLKRNLPAVKDLFGSDTNGDLLPDTGVAVAMDAYIRPFVQTGGIVAMKIGSLDSQIGSTNKRIDTYNQYLTRYEQDLKRKYGVMEGALNSLQKNSAAIDSFSNNNGGNR